MSLSLLQWLAPEKLRGCGALLLDPLTGSRFVDELGRRDEVSSAILGLPHADIIIKQQEHKEDNNHRDRVGIRGGTVGTSSSTSGGTGGGGSKGGSGKKDGVEGSMKWAWLLLGHEGAQSFGEGVLGFYASRGLVDKVRGRKVTIARGLEGW